MARPIKLSSYRNERKRQQVIDLAEHGGFYQKTIARWVYGSEDHWYKVGRILRAEEVRTVEYRKGESVSARKRIRFLMKLQASKKRKAS